MRGLFFAEATSSSRFRSGNDCAIRPKFPVSRRAGDAARPCLPHASPGAAWRPGRDRGRRDEPLSFPGTRAVLSQADPAASRYPEQSARATFAPASTPLRMMEPRWQAVTDQVCALAPGTQVGNCMDAVGALSVTSPTSLGIPLERGLGRVHESGFYLHPHLRSSQSLLQGTSESLFLLRILRSADPEHVGVQRHGQRPVAVALVAGGEEGDALLRSGHEGRAPGALPNALVQILNDGILTAHIIPGTAKSGTTLGRTRRSACP